PIVSQLYHDRIIEAVAYPQNPVFEAAVLFARTEGTLPAPESAHAIKAAVDEAIRCREAGTAKTILFNLSGHGHFDLSAYDDYLEGRLQDYEHPAELIAGALAHLPKVAEAGA
ncbi:MAG: TrpB-like pyridoxal-phosphate dependent enzyme, partial [Firmicutes bacterium]|nr:TrpB-like pyridoxal-phosphate dependent enzyme [Bacillota bacterium]